MYQMAVELHKTPAEIRAMPWTDFIYLVATMTRGAKKVIPMNKGGTGILLGWVENMKKQQQQGAAWRKR